MVRGDRPCRHKQSEGTAFGGDRLLHDRCNNKTAYDIFTQLSCGGVNLSTLFCLFCVLGSLVVYTFKVIVFNRCVC